MTSKYYFMSMCGSFNCDSGIVEERYIKLKSFIKGKKGVVVIPLN